MNIFKNPKSLPLFTLLAGNAAGLLRKALYAFALDHKGLLIPNHPLELILTVVSLLSLAAITAAVWKLDGSEKYEDNFSPSGKALAGHCLAAAGIALTVLLNHAPMPGPLGTAWDLLGLTAPVCLIAAGICRKRGKQPSFLLHLIPCLFLVSHIINHYQIWSGNPQLQDNIYTVFATMAMVLFSFYTTAFDVGMGRRRMHLGMGLAVVFLTLTSLSNTDYLFFYVGCACWAGSDLCRLTPVPKIVEEDNEEGGEGQ